ncbi:solute carrier family 41 member 2 [Drosophila grimshawi]|uniref:solute carrier family 41 member 2 n=1 Tax=Drosophila grimshawi TaxID=7222 RepID=UPI000C86FFC8|nr:solute carrier family 41 member 2 [Drosophila grimshawi]
MISSSGGIPPTVEAVDVPAARPNLPELDEDADEVYREPWYATLIQILIPFGLASLGTITAGVVFGNVENWLVFKQMRELTMIVPGLCGLKGNLDMCVAARLCTHAALGHLRQFSNIRNIIIGNVALVQVQAIISSLLLAIFTMIIKCIVSNTLDLSNLTTLISASIITASTSCLILDSALLLGILFSQRYRFNPDYFATPIVASIGDVTSVSMLAFTAASLYDLRWVSVLIVGSYLLVLLPFCIALALHNAQTRPVLFYGWISVIGALCISEFCGFILGASAEQFNGFTLFSPVINGSAGNLISVQANNMSSLLHQRTPLGKLPKGTRIFEMPQHALCYGTIYSRVSRLVIAISIPVASLLQLIILLLSAHVLVHALWIFKIDPDSAAIPYLTAFGDSLGTGLLAITFLIVQGSKYEYCTNKSPWLN